ncbi:hypothetical protein ASC66_07510 [Leifsonia sp. Root4]|uniref:DUF3048 domain-containing protein n=1 Tax=Leifsonia sp. Root4 TaxID=1736525 RepID=UPI0006FA8258|nr:DUF3048 domain-containing protein [Leifsonia sp. Root4]KQW06346.1 hypothetical protein ASC66_07510 [Leifsonia sp. Root4]
MTIAKPSRLRPLRMPLRRAAAATLTIGLLLATAACAAEVPAGAPSKTPRPTPTASATPTPPPVLAPLRGTVAPSGGLERPSLAAKIDNHEGARPQVGLERTDIVFEELVEGGLTRYVAIWHSDLPDEVGPVRSVRPMDPDIVTPFGGIIAYSGGQEVFVDMMMAAPVVNAVFDFDETGLFYRDDVHESPHDVIVRAGELVGRNADLPAPAAQFGYAEGAALPTALVEGVANSVVQQRFSDARWPSWGWDAASATWLRSQEGAPDLDAAGAQLRASNVVTLLVGIDEDSYEDIPRTLMIGTGEAWVSTGGKTVHGIWSKDSAAGSIRLVSDIGTPITLAPGNSWVELVPNSGSVEIIP